jgi:hypothetical protein
MKISKEKYASMYGPTVGDRFRLSDTSLIAKIEKEKAKIEAEKRKEQERIAREQEELKRRELAEKRDQEMAAKFQDQAHYTEAEKEYLNFNYNIDRVPGTDDLIGFNSADAKIYRIQLDGTTVEILKRGMQPELDLLLAGSPTYFKAIDGERVLIGIDRSYYLLNYKTYKIESDFILPAGVVENVSVLNEARDTHISIDKQLNRLVETDIQSGGRGRVFQIADRDILTNFDPTRDIISTDQENIYVTSYKGQLVYIHNKNNGKTGRFSVASEAQEEIIINNGVLYAIGRQDIAGTLKLKIRIKDFKTASSLMVEKEVEMPSAHHYYRRALNSSVVLGDYLIVGSHYGPVVISLESHKVIAVGAFGIASRMESIRLFGDILYIYYTRHSHMQKIIQIKNTLLE